MKKESQADGVGNFLKILLLLLLPRLLAQAILMRRIGIGMIALLFRGLLRTITPVFTDIAMYLTRTWALYQTL
jgi:hypothetical protein